MASANRRCRLSGVHLSDLDSSEFSSVILFSCEIMSQNTVLIIPIKMKPIKIFIDMHVHCSTKGLCHGNVNSPVLTCIFLLMIPQK